MKNATRTLVVATIVGAGYLAGSALQASPSHDGVNDRPHSSGMMSGGSMMGSHSGSMMNGESAGMMEMMQQMNRMMENCNEMMESRQDVETGTETPREPAT